MTKVLRWAILLFGLSTGACGHSREEVQAQEREIAHLRRELQGRKRQNAAINHQLDALAAENARIEAFLDSIGPRHDLSGLGLPPSFGIPSCDAYAARACTCRDPRARAGACELAHMGMMAWAATLASGGLPSPAIAEECVHAEHDLLLVCGG